MKKSYSVHSFENFLNNVVINEYRVLIRNFVSTLFSNTMLKLYLFNSKKFKQLPFFVLSKTNLLFKQSIKNSVSLDQVFQNTAIQIAIKFNQEPIYTNPISPNLSFIPFIDEVESNFSETQLQQHNLDSIIQVENINSDYDYVTSNLENSIQDEKNTCCFPYFKLNKARKFRKWFKNNLIPTS